MKKHLQKKYIKTISILFLIVIITIGTFLTLHVGDSMKQDEETNLLLRAEMLATMIDVQKVADLSGTEDDINNPSYQSIKEVLTKLRMLNTDTRFIYLMGMNENRQQFFYVDSESTTSEDYSAPGDLYLDATERDIINHSAGIPYTYGPYTDSWGEWVSAYAPIHDEDGTVLAMVGMDVTADRILLRIHIVQQAIILIFGLIFFITLLFMLHVRSSICKDAHVSEK